MKEEYKKELETNTLPKTIKEIQQEEYQQMLNEVDEKIKSQLPPEYLSDNLLEELINIEYVNERYIISKEFLDKYKNYPHRVVKDIEIFSKLAKKMETDTRAISDADELERYRQLPKGSLRNRGIFYSEGLELVDIYPELKQSTFTETINNVYLGRYMLPMKLPNGDVFSYMGYAPKSETDKYEVPKISQNRERNIFKQGNMLGNLDSLERYKDSNEIFIVEGYFDAVHLEVTINKPVIALLGSKVYDTKYALLKSIKEKYNKSFIYVPDFDISGTNKYLLSSNLWDEIYNYNSENTIKEYYNDIDDFIKLKGKDALPSWGLDRLIEQR